MLPSKKSKLLTTHYSLLIFGGIFLFLIFNFALWTFNSTPALAVDVPAVTGLSSRSLADTAVSIINAFLGLVGVIALGIFVYGGYLWMFSGGDPKKIQNAKKVLISAVIGLIIILLSWAIVSFIFNAVGGGGGNNVNNVDPPIFTESSYVFKVIDYAPKGPDIPICRAIQATFDREYQEASISDNLHLMRYCTDHAQCNGVSLGDCDRIFTAFAGNKFCARDIAGVFDYGDLNTVGFKPTGELEKMTDYKVLIDGGASGVQSDSGADCIGANDICKDWDFKTGDLSDKIPPQVLKVSPADGADNVCLVKSIAAQFNEEMYKPSLTKAGAFSTVPAHDFSPSAPSFTVLRESPKDPYQKNTDYYPSLNADTIMDACFNKLDGNKNATAEGSPTDNYPTMNVGVPAGTTSTWQFKTGETMQCVPKINDITPVNSYYENPESILTITGENFDDIADTILFTQNIPVSVGSLICFDGAFTQTNQACFTDSPDLDQWSDIKIVIKTPAGGLDSNGAITGPVKIKVGQFQCAGQPTCKDGTNKGLNCVEVNEVTDCPGSSCGDYSCDGGANAGLGCDSNLECSGAESNTFDIAVKSPHINNISPSTGPPGTWVTISGTQFGTTPGTVRVKNPSTGVWTDVALPCANSWNDNYIIIEIPTDFPIVGPVNVQVIASTDSRHSNINEEFGLNNNPLGPGICSMTRSCGEVNTIFDISGKRFGAVKEKVIFKNNNSSAIPLETEADITTAVWGDESITGVKVPVGFADGGYSVFVRMAGPPVSNSNALPFNKPCVGTPCDLDTTILGCQEDINICPTLGPTYSCNTATCMCENNPLPKVVQQDFCLIGTQSPSPYIGQTDSCLNAVIGVRFNKDMDDATVVKANIQVDVCGNDDCSSITSSDIDKTPWGFIFGTWDGVKEGFALQPNSDLLSNTTYRVTLKEAITANGYHLDGNGNGAPDGSTADDYSWIFKTSSDSCEVRSIATSPANMSIAVGGSKPITAIPQAENCNTLDASIYNWNWNSTVPAVADVSADDIMPAAGKKDPQQSVSGVAAGAAAITASISTELSISAGSSNITVTVGGGGGGACNNNGSIDNGETGIDCGGGGCPACNPGGVGSICNLLPQCDNVGAAACNLGLTCAPNASCTCQSIPTITATDWCKDSGGDAGKNTAITVKFSTLMDSASFKIDTGSGGTVSLTQAGTHINGNLGIINNGTNTEVTFYPSAQLGDSLDYVFTIKGGADGVKSKFGIRLDATSSSTFTTGTKLCKIDKVTILLQNDGNPDPIKFDRRDYQGPDLFTCAGKDNCPDDFNAGVAKNQHNAIAQSFDASGQELSSVAYSWTKSTDAPFTLVAPGVTDIMVQADPKSGIGALTVKADGGAAGIMSASTNVTVAPCDNPWQPTGTYPYKDDLAASPANPTNFSLWYCRDAGDPGTADDLPDLKIIKKGGVGELIREFFFYDDANPNDALGLRVYQNYDSAISNKQYPWSAREWYEKRAPNKQGAPASTAVDGWEGVQAGRSIYVNAANHLDVGKPKTHIYLMSHSDKISANLQNIYGQLKSNWKFAIGEYDDGTDGTSLNPPADRGHLRKLQRDTKRLSDLYDTAVDLYSYKTTKGKYPPLPSGSYIGGNSTSVWPSWDGELSKEVGAPLPHDPISQMSSLVGWWKLDDGSGAWATDDSSRGTDGELKPDFGNGNAPVWRKGVACKFGSCLEFDGIDDYVDLGSFSGLYSNKLTISAWIKTKPNAGWDDIMAGECGNFVFAVGDGNLKIEDQCGYTDNKGTDMEPLGSNKKIDDDKWHFVAATYDGLVVKLYIDGVFEISGPANGNFDTTGGNLYIGSTPTNISEFFDGSIDEVRIWNTPLSDAEINNLYKSNAAKFGSSEDSGWDQTENAFTCSAGADFDTHIYHYQNEPSEKNFSLYAALEWVGRDGSTWRQKQINDPYKPCTAPSSCPCYNYRQREVNTSDLGLCKNGQWDSSLGEICDSTVPISELNGLEGRICATGVCSVASTNAGGLCADNLQCPGGTCTPGTPSCDDSCQPFCPGAAVVKAVCGNGTIESPVENCECSDFNNNATCGTAKGLMSEYYCLKQNNNDDLSDVAVGVGEINDTFKSSVKCSPVDCNLACGVDGNPVRAEVNNAIYEPWVEQCEPKRGYCSNNSISCTQDSDCGVGNHCIALGNGGYYCSSNGAIQCNNGVRGCPNGETLTSCIGGAAEWLSCGGDAFPPKPYNYLETDLYGWCFR